MGRNCKAVIRYDTINFNKEIKRNEKLYSPEFISVIKYQCMNTWIVKKKVTDFWKVARKGGNSHQAGADKSEADNISQEAWILPGTSRWYSN